MNFDLQGTCNFHKLQFKSSLQHLMAAAASGVSGVEPPLVQAILDGSLGTKVKQQGYSHEQKLELVVFYYTNGKKPYQISKYSLNTAGVHIVYIQHSREEAGRLHLGLPLLHV